MYCNALAPGGTALLREGYNALPVRRASRAVVIGLGVTGLSCVRHLVRQGLPVSVVDTRAEPPMAARLREELPQVHLTTGELTPRRLAGADLVVVSPGVSVREPAIQGALGGGADVAGDVELFARAARAPVIAITGSNGKSTVTALVGEMCRLGGLEVAVGGNIGVPLLDLLAAPRPDLYVVELSSFQLETTESLQPLASTVLNVSADHMDRYPGGLGEYAAAKQRIYRGHGLAVVNRDDRAVVSMPGPQRLVTSFGASPPPRRQDLGLLRDDGESWLARGRERLMRARDVSLAGRHNLVNVLAAMALVLAVGVTTDAVTRAARQFRGLPHRAEVVAEHGGVRWINDSKGTNVGATVAALAGMEGPVVWLAGGDGKNADFAPLAAAAGRVRAVVTYGADGPRIARALRATAPVREVADLEQAVRIAAEMAQPGDAVLLSPACASFDQFRDYQHRGERFRELVHELTGDTA